MSFYFGIFLTLLGLSCVIASRISSKPPLLYLGLPGIALAIVGIYLLSRSGIDLKSYLPE